MIKLKGLLFGIKKYKSLIYELVIRDIKIRYKRSVLGLLWTLINPILMMTVMTLVFSNLFKFDIENFPIYLFAGNIMFSFMVEATTNALYSVTGNGSLIRKVYIPKYLFPLSKVLSSAVNLFFSFIAMMIVMAFTGVSFTPTLLLAPVLIIYLIIFCIGLGLILATLMVFYRDVAQLYSVITLAWMYLTPIFYPASLLSDKSQLFLSLNPMYHYIEYTRDIVLYNAVPSLTQNLTCIGISLVTLVLGLLVFYKKQDKFILYI